MTDETYNLIVEKLNKEELELTEQLYALKRSLDQYEYAGSSVEYIRACKTIDSAVYTWDRYYGALINKLDLVQTLRYFHDSIRTKQTAITYVYNTILEIEDKLKIQSPSNNE